MGDVIARDSSVAARVARAIEVAELLDVCGADDGRASSAAIMQSWDSEWSADSCLSRTGFPFELGFCTLSTGLRYTIEPCGPDVAPSDRFSRACELSLRLIGRPMPHPTQEAYLELQNGQPLKFGAWVSLRHTRTTRELKIYSEVPPGAKLPSDLGLNHICGFTEDFGTAAMLGYNVGTREAEVYCEVPGLRLHGLIRILATAGFDAQLPLLHSGLQSVCDWMLERSLPSHDMGISFSCDEQGDARAVTVYTFANALFGGDGRIRERILAAADCWGWTPHFYELISRPLVGRRGFETFHGMFGVTVTRDDQLGFTFGIAPPEADSWTAEPQ